MCAISVFLRYQTSYKVWDWTLVFLWCERTGRLRAVYGHVITKFSRMGRFTYPWCSTGALRAPEVRYHHHYYHHRDHHYCVRGTRTQPLICVGRSVHYWVPYAINKGGFFKIAFVIIFDTHLPRFEALSYVLPHFDELTHVLIRVSSSVCWVLLFCFCKAFIF